MSVHSIMPEVSRGPRLIPADAEAGQQLKADRLAVCAVCRFNQNGLCKECCGSVPVAVLVRLKASRCGKGFW